MQIHPGKLVHVRPALLKRHDGRSAFADDTVFRVLYHEMDLRWTDEDERDMDLAVGLIVDQAVEEARNERKGRAGDNRRRSTRA